MLYYLGKGAEFQKKECKEYKTKDGAVKAMEKTGDGVVWDENGQVIASAAGTVASVNVYVEDGNPVGTVGAETVAAVTGDGNAGQTGEGAEAGESGPNEDKAEIIFPQGTTKVTVICDGTLNLRRSADWGPGNICGRAVRGQSYYVKAIHTVNGKKMVQTIDGIYLSGQPEHVQFQQM